MKVLTKKQQEDILNKIAYCQVVLNKNYVSPITFTRISEALTDIAFDIGGIEGMTKIASFKRDED